ncbi:MAG: nitronate monooxygenase [Gammaproteobacteria bacterium]|nr:nitronate monooxygenase [Gammaproteobacteria bacterium]
MALTTSFTELVGCLHPVSCAGMGMASPELAIEVARAGGLGMTSGVMIPPPDLETLLVDMQTDINGQIGVNFIIPFLEDEASVEIAASNARVVDFFFGEPDSKLIATVHKGGALAGWQVGSVKEACAAADAGCDFVILQGTEAGGHVRGTRGLLTMMADVLDSVDLPVVAAGGIATARAVAMALAAGASAVRIGTRFVATPESGYHPDYINAIIASEGEDAVYTEHFSIGWEAPHRVLSNCIDAADSLQHEVIGKINFGGQEIDVPRNSVFGPMVQTTGEIDAMAQYAGQGVSAINSCEPAAEIMQQLTDGAEAILRADRDRLTTMLG